jgi:UDP-glucuronate decarboxylase
MKKVILITGGAGFIGSNLIKRLLSLGHAVICVDSFYSGKKANIAPFLANKDFRLIRHDIIQPLRERFERIDEIYNLACPASPIQYQFDPILTLNIAVNGTQNMLELARRYGARLLQASTSEVYGDPLEHPQREEYFGHVDCLGKRSCYDEGKRAGESLCKDYRQAHGVDVRIVRLFNIYGPNMMFNDGRVISNFMLQSLTGQDITVHGRGEQSRSFMYVDDLIDAFVLLMDVPGEKAGLGPYNVGNPEERSIKDLAEDVKRFTGSQSRVVFIDYEKIPERLGDPQQRCPDISRIQRLIDWQPRVSFADGLRRTYEDFQARLGDKTNVVVFDPTFYPLAGPAEEAVREIGQRLPVYSLDVITARMRRDLPREEKQGEINVYRVGLGNSFDKYLLPLLGALKALSLHKQRDYQLAWGIMASYGALTTMLFSFFSRRATLISLFEGRGESKGGVKKRILPLFYRLIFRRAHTLQIIADLDEQQLSWLSDEQAIRAIDIEKGWDYAAKKTQEEFQRLEILSSRL